MSTPDLRSVALRLVEGANCRALRPALESSLQSYRTYRISRGNKDDTIAEADAAIRDFYTFVGQDLGQITQTHYEAWGAHLRRERGLATESLRKYQTAVRLHLEYLLEHPEVKDPLEKAWGGRIVQVATRDNSVPRGGAKKRKVLFSSEMLDAFIAGINREIVRSITQGTKSWLALERDKALFYLSYCAGLRPEEAVLLNLGDFRPDLTNPGMGAFGSVLVLGKAPARREKKLRTVSLILPDLRAILEHYLATVRPRLLANSQAPERETALILSERGRRISEGTLFERFHRVCRLANLDRAGLTPHSLRVSFASHLQAIGVDLQTIQELLGHEHLHTTMIYTQADQQRVQSELARIKARFALDGGGL